MKCLSITRKLLLILILSAVTVSISILRAYSETVTITDMSAEAKDYFKRAQKAAEAGNYQVAADYFRKVLELEPDLAVAQQWLNNCLIQISFNNGVDYANHFEYEKAIEELKKALEIDNSLVEIHDWLAFCYVKSGMDSEAITVYEMVTQEKPTAANLINLAMALYRQGKLEEAEVSLRKALEIDPGNEDAVNNLCLVLLKLNRAEEVDALTREAIGKNQGNYLAYNNLGIALIKEYRFEEAVDALTSAIKKRPDLGEAHFSLAAAYIGLGDLKNAGDQYAIYLKLCGGDADKERDAINFLFDQNRYYDVPLEMRDHEE